VHLKNQHHEIKVKLATSFFLRNKQETFKLILNIYKKKMCGEVSAQLCGIKGHDENCNGRKKTSFLSGPSTNKGYSFSRKIFQELLSLHVKHCAVIWPLREKCFSSKNIG